jgi:CBS domain containing-hemolysin-like protein
MSMAILWALLWLAVLMVCSGACSGAETALFSMDRLALSEFGRTGGPFQRRVVRLMRRPRGVLMTILISNTTVNVAIFAISFPTLQKLERTSPALAAVGGVGVLAGVVLFGEVLPKIIALSRPRLLSPIAAVIVSVLQFAFAPILWLLASLVVQPLSRLLSGPAPSDEVTVEELKLLVEHSARGEVISSRENQMLRAVVSLGAVTVQHVMTPRVDIQSVGVDDHREDVLGAFRETGRRRLPVHTGDLDHIVGWLFVRDVILNPGKELRKLIRPAYFVPEHVNLVQLLRCFRTEAVHVAIVVDEYGGTTGLVSMQDVLQRIVGDLREYDVVFPASSVEAIDENTYRLPGALSAELWADRFGGGEIDRRINTIGGLIWARLGRMPVKGDRVRIHNLTLAVDSMADRRIDSVILHRDAHEAPGGEAR